MNELGVVERRSSELEEEPYVNPAHLPLARPELQDCPQKVRLLNDSFTDCDLSPGEVEAGGSGGQGRPRLHSKFKASPVQKASKSLFPWKVGETTLKIQQSDGGSF